MADDTSKTGKVDRERINVSQDYGLDDWARKFGVSREELRKAVETVGPMADDVRRHLGK
jgi:hypothetical protein